MVRYTSNMVSAPSKKSESATYSMAEETVQNSSMNKRRHRRGGGGPAEGDDNGSLTYSAGSSINSNGSSAAGESTDSSFADIMKYLDLPEGPELEALMRKEGVDPRAYAKAKSSKAGGADCGSATSSLNYSTDGESNLNGEHVLQTITGQPSGSFGPDGGGTTGYRAGNGATHRIIFEEADPVERKHRKKEKSSRKHKKQQLAAAVDDDYCNMPVLVGTPPPAPRRIVPETEEITRKDEQDYLYYAKWWMCGFTDALRDLVPKEH